MLFLVSEESYSVVVAQVEMGNSISFPSGALFPLEGPWHCDWSSAVPPAGDLAGGGSAGHHLAGCPLVRVRLCLGVWLGPSEWVFLLIHPENSIGQGLC